MYSNGIKGKCILLAILILTATFLPFFSTISEAAGNSASVETIKILEIQPTTSEDITVSMKSELETYFEKSVEITLMPMPLFISKAEEINGQYDIVYIGNNTTTDDIYNKYYKGNVYSRFGQTVANNCNVASSVSGNKEFYNGNDVSDIAAAKIKSFIESGQLIVFDGSIFSSGMETTKLYKNFNSYRNNSKYDNVKTGTVSTLLSSLKTYKSSAVKKRPTIKITNAPTEYNGSNISVNNGLMSFGLNLKNNNNSEPMKINLYIDRNGDGVFKSDELAQTYDDVRDINNFSINYLIPSKYTGLVPWKLEVEDNFGAKSYETGFSAFKGAELQIRVLQLLPDNNDNYATLKLSTLSNYGGKNLLYREGEYKIAITEMKISAFNHNYGNLVDGKPTTLNGNYDMVIFGFDDAYAGDLSGKALEDMEAFADSGQAIMFTHDTVGFKKSNLTTAFKDRLGMNTFSTDSSKPSGITISTGMTRLALLNANGDSRFPDTVLTCKINESNITKYPYVLDDIKVSPTHLQYIRLNPEDSDIVTAFTYRNEYRYNHGSRTATLITPRVPEDKYHEYDGLNDYYTYFKGNLTFSGTGHSPINSFDELKMFINTMLKASAGSNHAPSVSIIGLNNGQDIANTLDVLNFSLKASDPDIDDQSLNGKLYIDNDGDGIYEPGESVTSFEGSDALQSDSEKAVSISKNVSSTVTKFNIKAVVTDSSGAKGSTEISINNKSTPVLSLSHNTINCLVGDRVSSNITVKAQATTFNTLYRNLMLNLNLDTSKFGNLSAVGGGTVVNGLFTKTLDNVNFTPTPDILEQSGQVDYTCNASGTFNSMAVLSYTDSSGASRTVNDPILIDVKDGTVSVELKDNEGKSISSHTVTLRRYIKNISTGKFTEDTAFTPVASATGDTGVANFSSVPTGYYGASTDLPEGYRPIDNSQIGNTLTKISDTQLSYDNNNIIISFPALYRMPSINISGRSTMIIWTKQKLAANISPVDLYGRYAVKWQVAPSTTGAVSGEASIDPDTGILTANKIGQVTVTCKAVDKDPGCNEIIGIFEINITKNDIDIN